MTVLLEPVALARIKRGEEEHAHAKGEKDNVEHLRISRGLTGRSRLPHQLSIGIARWRHKEVIKVTIVVTSQEEDPVSESASR